MAKKKGVSYWKKKADAEFSKYIRKSNETKLGVQCYTCKRWYPLKKIQCGHYIKRSVNFTRYSEFNCKPQCVGCNCFKSGDLITFREELVKEYGEDKVKLMEGFRHQVKQFKAYELEDIYKKYKAKNK